MKLKLYFGIILFSLFFSTYKKANAQSPNWQWAKSIGGTGDDNGFSIATDASGNVYTTGSFKGTVDFDPDLSGIFNLTAAGGSDIFISKSDGSGNFLWAKAIGGTNYDEGRSITTDASGNVYLTGYFEGTVDFDPDLSGTFNLTSVNGNQFVSKFDGLGNFVWAKAMGGTGSAYSSSIVLDTAGSGNIYITGSFFLTVDFNPDAGVFNLTAAGTSGYSDIFISKLDTSGNFMWAKRMGGSGGSNDAGQSLALDPSGNGAVYSTGYFVGTADFDPGLGNFNLTTAGNADIFISKLDNAGNFVWAKRIGGLGYDDGNSIAIDLAANIYTTGSFHNTVDFDPGAGTFNLATSGLSDIFISKLDSSGNFIWAKVMGAAGNNNDEGRSIALDPAGDVDIYTSGAFEGTADFDPNAGVFNLTSAGERDIFISKVDSSGNFVWAKRIGGTDFDDESSMALDASGNVHVTGDFESPSITFGTTTLVNAGAGDIFIAKLDTAIVTGNNEIANFNKGVLLFPNPATNHLTIALENDNKKVEVTITDITGKNICTIPAIESQKIEISTIDFAEGIYVVQIQSADFIETKKFIVVK